MAKDWSHDFSLFAMAYPGLDPMNCTYAVFRAYLSRAIIASAGLHDRYTEEMEREDDIARMNRTILLKLRFPLFFPSE